MHKLFNANDQRKLRVCLLNISGFTMSVIVRLLLAATLDNDLIGGARESKSKRDVLVLVLNINPR